MENNAPLLTLGLVTCGRPDMVYFTLRRMKKFPCRILIADGSLTPLTAKFFPPNVEYMHIPNANFVTRLQAIIDEVQTPYCAFVAERRTIALASYQKCVAFLENNPEYSCAAGRIVYLPPAGPVPLYVFKGGLDGYRQESPLQRMHASYVKYQPLFYGVVRADIFKQHFLPPPFWRLAEVYVQNRLLIAGKAAILNCAYECILPSPPRVAKTVENSVWGHLLFPHLHTLLLPILAKKMQCAEADVAQHLKDVLNLDLMLDAYQFRMRCDEANTTLEMFLQECASDSLRVILDIVEFCSNNSELYCKAMSTLTQEGPDPAQAEEERLIQEASITGAPFDYASPWFTPEQFKAVQP